MELPRSLDRDLLVDLLRRHLPEVAARGDHLSPIVGGRREAEAILARLDPIRYARSRNFLDGAVTRLSPYIRHGVVSLPEVRDVALRAVEQPSDAAKFINELGWRDYWQRVWLALGAGIWQDREASKTRIREYASTLPEDLATGTTGLACMDAFRNELVQTGYLHNHARMWLAAYLAHWRRVRWQAGARWFLEHLLDADPASNNLSWQWVASTFSHKPYFFNRENLERYTEGRYCAGCPQAGHCDFEGRYEDLERRLFPRGVADGLTAARIPEAEMKLPSRHLERPIVWLPDTSLRLTSPVLRRYPQAQILFVIDRQWLQEERPSFKRMVFLLECLRDLPVAIRIGEPLEEVAAFARTHQADGIASVVNPHPRWWETIEGLSRSNPVDVVREDSLLSREGPYDLSRFSRYWRRAEKYAFGEA